MTYLQSTLETEVIEMAAKHLALGQSPMKLSRMQMVEAVEQAIAQESKLRSEMDCIFLETARQFQGMDPRLLADALQGTLTLCRAMYSSSTNDHIATLLLVQRYLQETPKSSGDIQ